MKRRHCITLHHREDPEGLKGAAMNKQNIIEILEGTWTDTSVTRRCAQLNEMKGLGSEAQCFSSEMRLSYI